jgi:hypothetical protein
MADSFENGSEKGVGDYAAVASRRKKEDPSENPIKEWFINLLPSLGYTINKKRAVAF